MFKIFEKIRIRIHRIIFGNPWRYELESWLNYYLKGAYETHFEKTDTNMPLPPLTLLDIGTGNYGFIKNNYKDKFRIICFDKVKTDFVDIIGDVHELKKNFKDKNFNIVTCLETFEHIENPFKAIDEIYKIINEDGFALLSTPFNYPAHGDYGDYWRFTEEGWIKLLKKFKQVKFQRVGNPKFPTHYLIKACK
jgi:ubiquinone/menaquinone biosynthesis C-methylase UbiE